MVSPADTRDGILGVDWGTTNGRVYELGGLYRTVALVPGFAKVTPGGFAETLFKAIESRPERRIIICGMAGARGGWQEVPYVPVPAGLSEIALGCLRVGDTGPYDVRIVPGVSCTNDYGPDMMRGEETQVFGAETSADALLCLPGTHSKWVRFAGRKIVALRTVMTGDVFAALSEHTILSRDLHGAGHEKGPFREGVAAGLRARPLTAELFSIRARGLTGELTPGGRLSFLSGLLIGQELAVMKSDIGPDFRLVADGDFYGLYREALYVAGIRDTAGYRPETAAQQGLRALAALLWPREKAANV